MIWHFHGKIASKQVLPAEEISYEVPVKWATSEPLNPSLKAFLNAAPVTLSVTTAISAVNQLKNQLEKGEPILSRPDGDEISFAQYWHDPKGKDHLFGVTLGLSVVQFTGITSELDTALLYGCPLWIVASGGFSSVYPNPNSIQPTQENFELGLPLRLSISRLVVNARPDKVGENER